MKRERKKLSLLHRITIIIEDVCFFFGFLRSIAAKKRSTWENEDNERNLCPKSEKLRWKDLERPAAARYRKAARASRCWSRRAAPGTSKLSNNSGERKQKNSDLYCRAAPSLPADQRFSRLQTPKKQKKNTTLQPQNPERRSLYWLCTLTIGFLNSLQRMQTNHGENPQLYRRGNPGKHSLQARPYKCFGSEKGKRLFFS